MRILTFVLRAPHDSQYVVLRTRGSDARPVLIARKLAKHFGVADVTVYHGGIYNAKHYTAKFFDDKREVWREYDIEVLEGGAR